MMQRTRSRFSLRNKSRTALVAALVLIGCLPSVQAHALTVTPRLEITANAGELVTESFRLQNEQRQSQTFYLSFANFSSVDETGNPSFSDKAEDLASWISGPDSVSVGPNETKDIPISINIPRDAEP